MFDDLSAIVNGKVLKKDSSNFTHLIAIAKSSQVLKDYPHEMKANERLGRNSTQLMSIVDTQTCTKIKLRSSETVAERLLSTYLPEIGFLAPDVCSRCYFATSVKLAYCATVSKAVL